MNFDATHVRARPSIQETREAAWLCLGGVRSFAARAVNHVTGVKSYPESTSATGNIIICNPIKF